MKDIILNRLFDHVFFYRSDGIQCFLKIKPAEFSIIEAINRQDAFIRSMDIFLFLNRSNKSNCFVIRQKTYLVVAHLSLPVQYISTSFNRCNQTGSRGFYDSSRADASGANPGMNGTAIFGNHMNPLEIWQPTSTSLVICMRHIVAGSWAFSTDFTYSRHDIYSFWFCWPTQGHGTRLRNSKLLSKDKSFTVFTRELQGLFVLNQSNVGSSKKIQRYSFCPYQSSSS